MTTAEVEVPPQLIMPKTKKRLTQTERMRRLLVFFYNDMLESVSEGLVDFADNIELLDAMKDCITDDAEGMREWSIDENGTIQFQ